MKILFVCTGNSFRSPVAEALLKKIMKDVDVRSAGTAPASGIAPNAKNLLKGEKALRYVKERPEALNEKMVDEADLIVVMKERHRREMMRRYPHARERIRVWDVDDPIFLPPGHDRRIMEMIKSKVKELASSL